MNSTTLRVASVSSNPSMETSIEEHINRWMELHTNTEIYDIKVFQENESGQVVYKALIFYRD